MAPDILLAKSDPVPVSVTTSSRGRRAGESAETDFSFPGQIDFYLDTDTDLPAFESLEFDIVLPEDAATNIQVLVNMKDWDFYWYQNLLPRYLKPGTNHLEVSLADAEAWKGSGHTGVWHLRALTEPEHFGIRVFGDGPCKGTCRLENVMAFPRDDNSAPVISNVRANADTVPCFEKYELTFALPDRYTNPFDTNQVWVTASFSGPDGNTTEVFGYYGQDYYREIKASEEFFSQQGAPYWRVRFAPSVEGKYTCTLKAGDTNGVTSWGPIEFTATKAELPGFVRVSKTDPRHFEFDNGDFFFPIGHNIRSPYDKRMDDQFPWVQRWPEGPSAYERYLKDMSAHGENFVEIWSCAWSLGLEWSDQHPGYHGVGQYNMKNAWELDRIMDVANEKDIYINLIIHNHGKFSTYCDEEWNYNPFNIRNGGYLRLPDYYFTDKRAKEDFRDLMRYFIARWGYSTRVFAWELWSELNLTGSRNNQWHYHRNPAVVAWHKEMGPAVKEMDPYDHMVSTHVSSDYKEQNPDIISLDGMDLCPVDAYHGSDDPVHIVELLEKTAEFNNMYNKPVIVTEFGGAWHGQTAKHLEETLHAALWSSTCIPIGATPLYWWWHLIEEQNFYPKYAGIQKFMKGVDRCDPSLLMFKPDLTIDGERARNVKIQSMKSGVFAIGWIYRRDFENIDPSDGEQTSGLVFELPEMTEKEYTVEFWNTLDGTVIQSYAAVTKGGILSITVPSFRRDIAFKVFPSKGD